MMQDDMLAQRIEVMLEMNAKRVSGEFAKLKEELTALRDEVSSIRRHVRTAPPVQPVPAAPAPAAPREAPVQAPAVEQPAPMPAQPRATEAIDRNGVAPADVSIEKIFYCGQK